MPLLLGDCYTHTDSPDKSSIFSAELCALFVAVKLIEDIPRDKFIIFTDSLSTLQGLDGFIDHPYVERILCAHHSVCTSGKEIVFCWIPSHVGIPGNEKADQAAKDVLTEVDFRKVPVPCTDIKQYINKHVFSLWQSSWDLAIHNKLHSLKPALGEWEPSYRRTRKDEVVLARCRIGHTYLTHAFLLKGEESRGYLLKSIKNL